MLTGILRLTEISHLKNGGPDLTVPTDFGLEEQVLLGESVTAIGDVDGDGIPDLAATATNYPERIPPSPEPFPIAGSIFIFFMNSDGTVRSHTRISTTENNGPEVLSDEMHPTLGSIAVNLGPFGRTVTGMGDVDGDEIPDIAVGYGGRGAIVGNDVLLLSGAIYILYLNRDGTVKGHSEIAHLEGGGPALFDFAQLGGLYLQAVGDLDGNGTTDLAASHVREGAVRDELGHLTTDFFLLFMDNNGTVLRVTDHVDIGDFAVPIGDVDGDSIEDLASGDPLANDLKGAIHILFMTDSGAIRDSTRIAPGLNGVPLSNLNSFGTSIAPVGDLNGDGVPDIATIASRDGSDGLGDLSTILFLRLNRAGAVREASLIGGGAETLGIKSPFQLSTLGDLDRDGRLEVAIGAPLHSSDIPILERPGSVFVATIGERLADHVSILTHGFNPFGFSFPFDESGDFLSGWLNAYPEVLEQFADAASTQRGFDETHAHYTTTWDSTSGWYAAFAWTIATILTRSNPFTSLFGSFATQQTVANMRRAERLAEQAAQTAFNQITAGILGGPNDGQTIHLIGHSRGAAVNARLSRLLDMDGYTVDQYTALDGYSTDWPNISGILGDISIVNETDAEVRVNYRVQSGLISAFLSRPASLLDNLLEVVIEAQRGTAGGFPIEVTLSQSALDTIDAAADWRAPIRSEFRNITIAGTGDQPLSDHLNVSNLYFGVDSDLNPTGNTQFISNSPIGRAITGSNSQPVRANRPLATATQAVTVTEQEPFLLDGDFEASASVQAEVDALGAIPDFTEDFLDDLFEIVESPAYALSTFWDIAGNAQLVEEGANTLLQLVQSSETSIGQFLVLPDGPASLAFDLNVVNAGGAGILEVALGDRILRRINLRSIPGRSSVEIPLTGFESQSHQLEFRTPSPTGAPATIRMDNVSIVTPQSADVLVNIDAAGNLTINDQVPNGSTNNITVTQDSSSGEFVVRATANQLGDGLVLPTDEIRVPRASVTGGLIVHLGGGFDRLVASGTGLDVSAMGGRGNDTLITGGGNDTIFGESGNDRIFAGSGRDIVFGGEGNDRVFGEGGYDTLSGGMGNDFLRGGRGQDQVRGEAGQDEIYGDDHNDTLNGGDGADTLNAGGGNDAVFAGDGFDSVNGGDGNDRLFGNGKNDVISGGDGNDFIRGGSGADRLFGGNGSNEILGGEQSDTITGGNNSDSIRGGAGIDRVFAGGGNDLVHGEGGNDELFGEGGNDTITGGQGDDVVRGGDGQDNLSGDTGQDAVFGDRHADTLKGGDGADTLTAGDGPDAVFAGNGFDSVDGGAGNDRLFGNDQNDVISGGLGNDLIRGGRGSDRLTGDAGFDEIHGDEDPDTLSGNEGNDTLNAGSGADRVFAGLGNDLVDGGNGNDTLFGDGGFDTLSGDDGRDLIRGGREDDVLRGNGGFDTLFGDPGNDRIFGGDGNDTAYGGNGRDIIFGDGGNDRIFGENGYDTIRGGIGNDFLRGGRGNDSLVGDNGQDQLIGDQHNDTLIGGDGGDTITGGEGSDRADGGPGADVIDVRESPAPDGIDSILGGDIADLIFKDPADLLI